MISAIVTAAGLSSRMGEFKPLLPFGGRTVIETTLLNLLSGGVEHIVLVLGHRAADVRVALEGKFPEKLTFEENTHYAETDMLTSLKLGASVLPQCDAFFILPGDMPLISPDTLRLIISQMNTHRPLLAFPTLEGRRKHPPLLSASLKAQLLDYTGENGLRGFFAGVERILEIPVADIGCGFDLDTPEQYEKANQLRAENRSFGQNLRALREAKGLSLTEFAEKLRARGRKITDKSLARLEDNAAYIFPSDLRLFSEALDAPLSALFEGIPIDCKRANLEAVFPGLTAAERMSALVANAALGMQLRRLRRNRHIHHVEMAELLLSRGREIDKDAYIAMEQGRSNMRLSDLLLLREILDTPLEAFFEGVTLETEPIRLYEN